MNCERARDDGLGGEASQTFGHADANFSVFTGISSKEMNDDLNLTELSGWLHYWMDYSLFRPRYHDIITFIASKFFGVSFLCALDAVSKK